MCHIKKTEVEPDSFREYKTKNTSATIEYPAVCVGHQPWSCLAHRAFPGARDRLWPSRLLGKLANFNFTRIIPWTLVVNAGMAVETLEWAVCSGRVWKPPHMCESICNANVWAGGNYITSWKETMLRITHIL